MRFLLFLGSMLSLHAGTLQIKIHHQFDGRPLSLNSLRYQGQETFSISRLSYLLSEFSIQNDDGTWIDIPNQFAYLDLAKRRTSFTLSSLPQGSYQRLRFSLGLPQLTNHANPAELPADHPLNPNVNQLHWDWQTGYIFLALEGRYRTAKKELQGYVYHLANDANLTKIQQEARFQIKENTEIQLAFEVQNLFQKQRTVSFQTYGHSSHSHPDDPIAKTLAQNIANSFSLLTINYPAGTQSAQPEKKVLPLYLPEKFTPFQFKTNRHFPRPQLPLDNPLLKERVTLGEDLFHDSILSIDGTISCAACHDSNLAFSDERKLSEGFNGRLSKRHSMPLFNLAWKSSFFWDGRAASLREQVLEPIQDPREMAANLRRIIARLNRSRKYSQAFTKAFGPGQVTSEKLALALENYLLTLTSYDSKFDQAIAGKKNLSESEQRGMKLFFTEYEPRNQQYGADCFHCHGGANFSDHQFHNNGLKPTQDLGRFSVTKDPKDRFHFSTPSLRNVGLTPPYMHDGRFATLAEVVEHYSSGIHRSETLDPNLAKHPRVGLQFSEQAKADLVAFLKTLTDPKYGP